MSAVVLCTHHTSITTLPFGRLVCGRRACPSRTLYRLFYYVCLPINHRNGRYNSPLRPRNRRSHHSDPRRSPRRDNSLWHYIHLWLYYSICFGSRNCYSCRNCYGLNNYLTMNKNLMLMVLLMWSMMTGNCNSEKMNSYTFFDNLIYSYCYLSCWRSI